MLGALERKDIREKTYSFSEATPLDDIEERVDEVQKATIELCLKKFSIWLIREANRDSKTKLRQTKAYDLWLRFTKDYPQALPNAHGRPNKVR